MSDVVVHRIDSSTILLILAILCGIAEVITGIVGIIKIGDASLTTCQCVDFVNASFALACFSALIILFGIITIVSPFKPVILINRLFLWSYLIFGIFMIIAGIMCLGVAGDLGFGVGICNMVVGLVYVVMHFAVERYVVAQSSTTTTTTKV